MNNQFENIKKTEKKNKLMALIYAVIITVGMVTLTSCSIEKENIEDVPSQLATENSTTKDIQTEIPRMDELSPKSDSYTAEIEQSLNDCSIVIGSISFSINENKQDILEKLGKTNLNYSECKPDNPEEKKFDSYYSVDALVQIYFMNDVCVRLRAVDISGSDGIVQTVRGINPGSTYSQMVEQYGDDFEAHIYAGKEVYKVYRYSINGCIYEFGVCGEERDSIYNMDIYLPNQMPIYDYGEELIN